MTSAKRVIETSITKEQLEELLRDSKMALPLFGPDESVNVEIVGLKDNYPVQWTLNKLVKDQEVTVHVF